MRKFNRGMIALAGSLGWSGVALAGPEWVEVDDAGNLPGISQAASGGGQPLTKIKGQLTGLSANLAAAQGGDFQDMYVIQITDPANFFATTVTQFGGSADFDSNLFLFKLDGNGLLGNDDTAIINLSAVGGGISSGSTLGNTATDPTGQTIPGPGLYLLAISGPFQQPLNEGGLLFTYKGSTEVSGPDGPGGGSPISDWQNVGLENGGGKGARRARGVPTEGNYEILLNGVSTVPPQAAQLNLDIRPGQCPNNFAMSTNGGIIVALVGTETFNVQNINLDTVIMVRSDGWGGLVQPSDSEYTDNSTPFLGTPCGCHALGGDGIQDLSMVFSKAVMKQAFLLSNSQNGDFVSLTVCGFLLDGTPFTSHDCIKIITN